MFWSIRNLEEKLLSQSTCNDIFIADKKRAANASQTLTPEQIKKETSVLSRILINGYCGWPFHSKLLKWSVLLKLNKLFDSAAPLSAKDFFNRIGAILGDIPDNHLCIYLGSEHHRCKKKRKFVNVGENIAKKADYKICKSGPFAIIAVPKLWDDWVKNPEKFIEKAKAAIEKSQSVIVDLRGNSGGRSWPLNLLARHLYGADTPISLKAYVRGTPEGAVLRQDSIMDLTAKNLRQDPCLWMAAPKKYPRFAGIANPIYILTDGGTCSSAELFITCMLHHPHMKIVGDNTTGCEIYGWLSETILPNTGIIVNVGNVYHELEAGNIELKGYAPDIRVPDGLDALAAAMADFYNRGSILKPRGGKTK
jgi:hypothetical protein